MVKLMEEKGITDERILEAMEKVPRHLFVENAFADQAYEDKALPIQDSQTISQPFTVAFQTQLLGLGKKMKILEVGTGSGYQAAILHQMGMRVFSIEIHNRLYQLTRQRLKELDYNIKLSLGDGSQGWPQFQPYQRILVTAAAPAIPRALKEQLEIGGKMVIPVGNSRLQRMTLVEKESKTEFKIITLDEFRFVPLRGKYGFEAD